MGTTVDIGKLEALAGTDCLGMTDDGLVAAHVIDGIIDNEDCNGPGTYPTWTAAHAVELYADEAYLEREGYDAADIDWDGVRSAVAEALRVLQLPIGVVLVNGDDALIHSLGADLTAAQAEVEKIVGSALVWEEVSRREFDGNAVASAAGRYIAYIAPIGDWSAGDTWRVKKLADRKSVV